MYIFYVYVYTYSYVCMRYNCLPVDVLCPAQVTSGMDVVNKISKVKCDRDDNPVTPVKMIKVTVA